MNSYVIKKHPDKESLCEDWMASKEAMTARAGWSLTAERIVKRPDGLDLAAARCASGKANKGREKWL